MAALLDDSRVALPSFNMSSLLNASLDSDGGEQLTGGLDASLVLSVFIIACRSIAKALLVVGAGVLLTRRGALTPAVRKGLSVMSAGLLVPCLLLERFSRT
eukprot:4375225-Prymnesium_polylepis.2